MSNCCREIRWWFRGDRRHTIGPNVVVAAVVMLATPGWAQQPRDPLDTQQSEPHHALPSGIRFNSIAGYAEGDYFQLPYPAAGLGSSQLWLFTSGATGDVAAHFGQRTQFSANYQGGYSYNHRYDRLNGANHRVSLELQTDPARHTVFAFGATGETGLVSDALFDPSYALSVAQQSVSLEQLAQGLTENSPELILNSAVELALSGGRHKSGAAFARISHTDSRRLTLQLQAGAVRELHSYSREQLVLSQYPNVTIGMADLRLTYALSRRTRISGDVGYTRSYSREYRADWQSSGMGIEHEFGRRSFGSLQGGYVRISEPGSEGFGRSSYTMGAAYGTTKGYHTVAMRFRRGAGDVHGLGSQSTIGFDGAWSWNPHATSWALGSGLGYERLEGGTPGRFEAWICQATAVRRLSAHFEMALTAVYMAHSSPGLEDLTRTGLRTTLIWRPNPEPTH